MQRFRWTLIFPLFAAFGLSPLAHAQNEEKTLMKVTPLETREQWSVPWEEVSGIKLFDSELYIASDASLDLGRIPWRTREAGQKRLDLVAGEKRTLTLDAPNGKKKKKAKAKKSQWEAVSLDKTGRVYLIKETTDELHAYDPEGKALRTVKLSEFKDRPSRDKGFEGLALLKNGHVLIALTDPPILIEYGPSGEKAEGSSKDLLVSKNDEFPLPKVETFSPLGSWKLAHESGCEYSDLAVSDGKKLFALLKDCNRIIELPSLDPQKTEVSSLQSWSLPQGVPHPEGLEALGDEGFLVASDVRAIEKNVFWLAPVKGPN